MGGTRNEGVLNEIPVLAGPTASGKTALALQLGESWRLEVVSADAMMVYRGMDVGTAKPTTAELARVPHHLIDVAEPDEDYSVARWVRAAEAAIGETLARGRTPLVVGGTGFYIRSLTEGLPTVPRSDPDVIAALEGEMTVRGIDALTAELAAVSPEDAERARANPRRMLRALEVVRTTGRPPSWFPRLDPRYRYRKVVLSPPPPLLDERIRARTRAMLAGGLLDETARLRDLFERTGRRPTALQAIGYREALAVLDGTLTLEEAEAAITLATRQYARRQRTWFRKEPGATQHPSPEDAAQALEAALRTVQAP